jgi:CheY-like chemotaxis protein
VGSSSLGSRSRSVLPTAGTAGEGVTAGNRSSFCSHHILFVDDDVAGLRARGEIFEGLGYSVVLCDSPAAALGCDPTTFDLGVLEFHLRGLNGRELLLRMRAAGAKFPIILLTGFLDGLTHEDRVLFARCVDKGEPIQRLFDCIAELLDPNQLPDYGA